MMRTAPLPSSSTHSQFISAPSQSASVASNEAIAKSLSSMVGRPRAANQTTSFLKPRPKSDLSSLSLSRGAQRNLNPVHVHPQLGAVLASAAIVEDDPTELRPPFGSPVSSEDDDDGRQYSTSKSRISDKRVHGNVEARGRAASSLSMDSTRLQTKYSQPVSALNSAPRTMQSVQGGHESPRAPNGQLDSSALAQNSSTLVSSPHKTTRTATASTPDRGPLLSEFQSPSESREGAQHTGKWSGMHQQHRLPMSTRQDSEIEGMPRQPSYEKHTDSTSISLEDKPENAKARLNPPEDNFAKPRIRSESQQSKSPTTKDGVLNNDGSNEAAAKTNMTNPPMKANKAETPGTSIVIQRTTDKPVSPKIPQHDQAVYSAEYATFLRPAMPSSRSSMPATPRSGVSLTPFQTAQLGGIKDRESTNGSPVESPNEAPGKFMVAGNRRTPNFSHPGQSPTHRRTESGLRTFFTADGDQSDPSGESSSSSPRVSSQGNDRNHDESYLDGSRTPTPERPQDQRKSRSKTQPGDAPATSKQRESSSGFSMGSFWRRSASKDNTDRNDVSGRPKEKSKEIVKDGDKERGVRLNKATPATTPSELHKPRGISPTKTNSEFITERPQAPQRAQTMPVAPAASPMPVSPDIGVSSPRNSMKPAAGSGQQARFPGRLPGILRPNIAPPIAKMFVICCQCSYWHDLPSGLYEKMASLENTARCTYCHHGMSTQCCEGYTCVVFKHEKHH